MYRKELTNSRLKKRYDIIGDIHGHADALEKLLEKLGYRKHQGVYKHSTNKAIFLGDFIDRGPDQRAVLDLVMPMVNQGYAMSVMGNHEFNAIGYATLDQAGEPLRKHSVKNNKQHSAFLEAYPLAEERQVIIDWFKTLPLYIETESIRVVHANWNDRAIQILDNYLDNNQRLKDDAYDRASAKESELYHAVETVLKGPEVRLPDGVFFSDNDGIVRTKARVNWWVPQESLLEEKLQLGSELKNEQNLKAMALDDGVNYDSKAKPLFVGHYWLKDEIPKPLSGNSVCVDYSIAKSGKLVAYQWQGEEVLNESQFVW